MTASETEDKFAPRCDILGTRVSSIDYDGTCEVIGGWINAGESRYICSCTVHMTMEGYDNGTYRSYVNGADLVTPDGMPLVWFLRRHGFRHQTRVYAPDLMKRLLERAGRTGWKIGLYGSDQDTLNKLTSSIEAAYPNAKVAYAYSPPFRPLTEEEYSEVEANIIEAGVELLFVGLGCPKQETWMARMSGKLPCTMIGVGASFAFLAGTVKQAPGFMQRAGLEWLYRMSVEPKRLWRRYLTTNPRFMFLWFFPSKRSPAIEPTESGAPL